MLSNGHTLPDRFLRCRVPFSHHECLAKPCFSKHRTPSVYNRRAAGSLPPASMVPTLIGANDQVLAFNRAGAQQWQPMSQAGAKRESRGHNNDIHPDIQHRLK